ncbi:PreQ0 pathway QueF-like protein [Mycobacterium phage Funsized]|nr:PreQ0 pathway QueF-like protein [Mycobacterium phage Funsized]
MTTTHDGVLGRVHTQPLETVETLPISPANTPKTVTARCTEVQACCPVTLQPDLYTVVIEYRPDKGEVIESKSLKLYLWKFRDRGISCEELAATIANELSRAIESPVTVTAHQASRGGIELSATHKGSVLDLD